MQPWNGERVKRRRWHEKLLLETLGKTIFFYFAILLAVRVMGKREIGAMSPTDLVVAIMLAELAAISIDSPDTSVWMGVVPIVTIVALEMLFSFGMLRSIRLRAAIHGRPSVVVQNGRILESALRANRYNLDELMQHLREKGWPDIRDVEFAILESDGKLSVIPKSQKRPVCPEDLGIETKYEGLPLPLIKDGTINESALRESGLGTRWLMQQLAERKIHRVEDVFFATLSTTGELYIQLKEERARG